MPNSVFDAQMLTKEAPPPRFEILFGVDMDYGQLSAQLQAISQALTHFQAVETTEMRDETYAALCAVVEDLAYWTGYTHKSRLAIMRLKAFGPILFNKAEILSRFRIKAVPESKHAMVAWLNLAGIDRSTIMALAEACNQMADDLALLLRLKGRAANYCKTFFKSEYSLQSLCALAIHMEERTSKHKTVTSTWILQKDLVSLLRARIKPPRQKDSPADKKVWAVRKRLDRFIWDVSIANCDPSDFRSVVNSVFF